MEASQLLLAIAVAALVTLVGLVVRSRVVAPDRAVHQDQSGQMAFWVACDRYRQQVAEHVDWRLGGRSGRAPLVGSAQEFDALGLAVALQSPGPVAKAAGGLLQQTESLGKTFVRDEAGPWIPDREDWEAALAEWHDRAREYAVLAQVDVPDSTPDDSADPAHRHTWSRPYTLRRRGTGGWVLEYGGSFSQMVVLPEGKFSAGGDQFRECERCGTWDSRKGSRGSWKADVYSRDAPSPRAQILGDHQP
jgi:hypothetical protein